jgi:hypothetical protein
MQQTKSNLNQFLLMKRKNTNQILATAGLAAGTGPATPLVLATPHDTTTESFSGSCRWLSSTTVEGLMQ